MERTIRLSYGYELRLALTGELVTARLVGPTPKSPLTFLTRHVVLPERIPFEELDWMLVLENGYSIVSDGFTMDVLKERKAVTWGHTATFRMALERMWTRRDLARAEAWYEGVKAG